MKNDLFSRKHNCWNKQIQEFHNEEKISKKLRMRLPGVEPGSIAWKAIILTVGLQTPNMVCWSYKYLFIMITFSVNYYYFLYCLFNDKFVAQTPFLFWCSSIESIWLQVNYITFHAWISITLVSQKKEKKKKEFRILQPWF